jgi:quinol monooxygenase YgiN
MPGCLSYIIAKDSVNEDTIWVSEAWDSEASHYASLLLTSVKDTLAKAKPIIAGFTRVAVTEPVGGCGLLAAKTR